MSLGIYLTWFKELDMKCSSNVVKQIFSFNTVRVQIFGEAPGFFCSKSKPINCSLGLRYSCLNPRTTREPNVWNSGLNCGCNCAVIENVEELQHILIFDLCLQWL